MLLLRDPGIFSVFPFPVAVFSTFPHQPGRSPPKQFVSPVLYPNAEELQKQSITEALCKEEKNKGKSVPNLNFANFEISDKFHRLVSGEPTQDHKSAQERGLYFIAWANVHEVELTESHLICTISTAAGRNTPLLFLLMSHISTTWKLCWTSAFTPVQVPS